MTDQKNTILAIVLSALVLIAGSISSACRRWRSSGRKRSSSNNSSSSNSRQQQPARRRRSSPASRARRRAARSRSSPARAPRRRPASSSRAKPCSKASPRVAIETPRAAAARSRSRAAAIDDLALTQYRETVDPKSPPIVLLSPSGSPHPFYAEFGWVGGAGSAVEAARTPTRSGRQQGSRHARRRQAGDAHLRQRRGPGIPPHHLGRRQVPVHVEDQVTNKGGAPVTLYPYALISPPRHAGDARLLHPARRPDRRARRQGCRNSPTPTIEDKKNVTRSRRPTPGSASPTSTGRRR